MTCRSTGRTDEPHRHHTHHPPLCTHKLVTLPRSSQATPFHPVQTLVPLAIHPCNAAAEEFPPAPLDDPVTTYRSLSAQNCKAAPTPVESPTTKSLVVLARSGEHASHG
jgi:hypothetical protein